jgi:hypothetical protein
MVKSVPYLVEALLALASSLTSAYDPSPLQDFCVAINNSNSAAILTIIAFFWYHYRLASGLIFLVLEPT